MVASGTGQLAAKPVDIAATADVRRIGSCHALVAQALCLGGIAHLGRKPRPLQRPFDEDVRVASLLHVRQRLVRKCES
jgi:hypothetical protein